MPNVFDSSSAAIGSVQASLLTEAEFQSIFGTGWVLARGQSVSGSKYASITGVATVPDMRGMFLRGKNNGRSDGNQDSGGERNLRDGTVQVDQVEKHIHSLPTGTGAPGSDGFWGVIDSYWMKSNVTQGFNDAPANNEYAITSDANSYPGTPPLNLTKGKFGTETRPRNVTVNYFIRIN
jgi:hypothetical protein